ncbi:MAG: Na+/H+ antiporter subunit E [Bacteroidales bacterium]|nr:Na+/H+ antiporter subunit E [Bacteroidales bacterium]
MSGKPSAISQWVYAFLLFFVVWYAFTTSLEWAELITGAIVAAILAFFTYKMSKGGMTIYSPLKLIYLVQYFFVFLFALIKANLDVAKRVISPSLPINPGIVEFKTQLTSEFAKMVLANSITLTPGTVTIDVIDDMFYVHWIDVETEDPEQAYMKVAEPFEKILLKIYG